MTEQEGNPKTFAPFEVNCHHTEWREDLDRWNAELEVASHKLAWAARNVGMLGAAWATHRQIMAVQEQEMANKGQLQDAADVESYRRVLAAQHALHESLRCQHERFLHLVEQLEMAIAVNSFPN